MDEFKERQRAMWAAGDYPTVAEHIGDVGEYVVARSGVTQGMQVLDVACGTGNAAVPAAREGARVSALDLTPELLEAGRTRAAAEGVEIEWVEGDAEALPFAGGAFHRVISTFGHMFAPRHRQTADEMARVCRDGGSVAICCWTPEGVVGDLLTASGKYMPPAPEYALPPVLWGTEGHVREMFGSAVKDFEFERRDTILKWESLEGFADFFTGRFPPFVTARRMLGDRFQELRNDLLSIWNERNEASDGSFLLRQEYLVSIVRL